MAEILIPIFFFLSVLAGILGPRYLRYKHEQRMKELEGAGGDARALKALTAERSALEQRIQALESIVCNVDFELNAKLNRLATRHLALEAALPPAAGGPSGQLTFDRSGSAWSLAQLAASG